MILIIDNFDSFSYIIYQMAGKINSNVKVARRGSLTPAEIDALNPSHIIISPGSGKPSGAQESIEIVRELGGKYPILGICLGHLIISEAFGGETVRSKRVVQGKAEIIKTDSDHPMFAGIGKTLKAARYHSYSVCGETIPDCLEVTSWAEDGEIMAIAHRELKIWGVQFHPESIMTPQGEIIFRNFLRAEE